MIGRTLSHYRIVAELGAGGMGTVYRAEDTVLGRPVALKFPHAQLVSDGDARARFLREARVASALDHPNIVTLYDVCDAGGEAFIAMQCVEGRSLRDRLDTGPLPLCELLEVGRAVADALAHAHGRGVVHRDIKPDNILLDREGRVKVADFGTARVLEEALTRQSGEMVGTPAYLAPEVIGGTPAGPRADLYALGVLLYEMVAGAPPFEGSHVAEVLYRIAHGPPPPLPPAAPTGLQQLIERLLARDPARRPASAIEVADALVRLAGAPGTPEDAGAPARAPERSLAVLPFANLTGDATEDYFCAGIAEDLLTELLKIPDLKVASRTHVATVAAKTLDLRQAAQALGVSTVLEGGVRRADDRVRVTARLVHAGTGYQMWAERYDRRIEDLFDVQEDIAGNIAAALRVALGPAEGDSRLGRRTRSARAYDLRLRALARYRRFEEPDMREAIALLEQAVAEDPEYALARADLAECQVQMVCKGWDRSPQWLARAEREAERALAIAPLLPEGYRARGHVANHRRAMRRGIEDFARAVELDPRFSGALVGLAVNHMYLGDLTGAEVYCRRALAADPLDARGILNLGIILARQRRFEESREVCERYLAGDTSPGFLILALETLALARLAQDDRAGAEAVVARVPEALRDRPGAVALRALAAAGADRRTEAAALLADLDHAPPDDAGLAIARARVHAMLGERDRAIAWLARAGDLDALDASELGTDPHLRPLADDPRVAPLLAAPL